MRGPVLLGGAILAALLTWAPVISDTPEQAITETPLLVLVSVLLLLAAVTVRATDKRLSWVIAVAGLAWLLHPGAAPTESLRISLDRADMVMTVRGWPASVTWMVTFAVVVLGLHLVRGLPARVAGRAWTDWLGIGLVGLAVFEVLYATLQFVGLDPIWSGWHVGPRLVLGTLGNSGAVSLLLALAAPFAPLAVLPVIAWGFLVVQGKLAIVAAVAGVAWQHREQLLLSPPWARALGAVWIAVPIWVALVWHGTASVTERLRIAGFGVSDLLASPLIGHGPGAWAWRIPAMQFAEPRAGAMASAAYTTPHSDLLGWAHATGLLGLLVLGWWLWNQARVALVSPVGGAWVALVICMLGWSVSTIPTLALPALLIWGTATRETRC